MVFFNVRHFGANVEKWSKCIAEGRKRTLVETNKKFVQRQW